VAANFSSFDGTKVLGGKLGKGPWVTLEKGRRLEIAFPGPTELSEVLVDSAGVGPNAWPYEVYAPRTRFALELSADGRAFRKVAEGSLGPAYTLVRFERAKARKVRFLITEADRTTAYAQPIWEIREVFAFNPAELESPAPRTSASPTG
jgi:hypothetical protein